MAGRGRGRSKGGLTAFSREQLDYMGAGSNVGEQLPRPVTQPPPVYPILDSKPAPLQLSKDSTYMLILKQDFLEHMQYKSAYVNLPTEVKEPELEIDKLLAQLPKMQESCKFDWRMLPKELRSKITAKRNKVPTKEIDLGTRLDKLEKMEQINRPIKKEAVDPEEEEEVADEEQDEEMDEGTDYVNNYFDNGEEYEDEIDNEEDGPIY